MGGGGVPYLDAVPGLVSPCRKQKNTTKWREHFFMLWTSLGLPPRQQISFMESIVLDDDTERGRETVCITVSHCFTSYQYKHDTVTQWEEPTQDHCLIIQRGIRLWPIEHWSSQLPSVNIHFNEFLWINKAFLGLHHGTYKLSKRD